MEQFQQHLLDPHGLPTDEAVQITEKHRNDLRRGLMHISTNIAVVILRHTCLNANLTTWGPVVGAAARTPPCASRDFPGHGGQALPLSSSTAPWSARLQMKPLPLRRPRLPGRAALAGSTASRRSHLLRHYAMCIFSFSVFFLRWLCVRDPINVYE